MIDPYAVDRNLSEWLENPSWKAIYENAPTEESKKYLEMLFYASETEEDEAFNALDALEELLKPVDYEYMYSFTQGPERAKWARKMAQK